MEINYNNADINELVSALNGEKEILERDFALLQDTDSYFESMLVDSTKDAFQKRVTQINERFEASLSELCSIIQSVVEANQEMTALDQDIAGKMGGDEYI